MGRQLTLGEATARADDDDIIACACIGPPPPAPLGSPCMCALANLRAEQLRRAAHIVAKLIAQLIEDRTE